MLGKRDVERLEGTIDHRCEGLVGCDVQLDVLPVIPWQLPLLLLDKTGAGIPD